MAKRGAYQSWPMFVVLRETARDQWTVIGEVAARPGLSARLARRQAILDATDGKARDGAGYAAVPRSYWRLFQVWSEGPPDPT